MTNMVASTGTKPGSETVFEIFRNRIGRWCARRADGLVVGTFFERGDALNFARRQCRTPSFLELIIVDAPTSQS
jgi:hypothetical protein